MPFCWFCHVAAHFIYRILFTGDIRIVGGAHGVHFTFSREGRPSGEAFVELASENDCQNAITKHNEHMGSRYIEGELFS